MSTLLRALSPLYPKPIPDVTVPAEVVQIALALAVIDFARDPDFGHCSIAAWLTTADRIHEIDSLTKRLA